MPKLFCLSTVPTQSGEPLCYDQGRVDRKRVAYRAVSNLVSITFCERCTWILRFCDAWLLGIVMSVQVSRFTAQFCKKYWMVWFKSYSILKMSGIDGSFILYNNLRYWIKTFCWQFWFKSHFGVLCGAFYNITLVCFWPQYSKATQNGWASHFIYPL